MSRTFMDEQARSEQKLRWQKEYLLLLSPIKDEPMPRVKAHIDNLDEYFLRWLGFCRLETQAPQELTEGGLFIAIEAATGIADIDVARLIGPKTEQTKQAWTDYLHALDTLRRSPRTIKTRAEQCYLQLRAFAEAFRQLETPRAHGPGRVPPRP
jgi:hypothetical protein